MASHVHHPGHDHAHDHDGGAAPSIVPLDPASESLSQALRAGFNVLRILMIVLLLLYFFSGLFQVNPGQQGLIVRFGKLRENAGESGLPDRHLFGPGWHASLPDPFDTKIRLPGTAEQLEIATFSFPRTPEQIKQGQAAWASLAPQMEKLQPQTYGTMLSGDRNLSHGLFTIEYRIDNGAEFVANVGEKLDNLYPLLTRLAEAAVVRTVSGIRVEQILRRGADTAGDDFTLELKSRLNKELEALHAGVVVTKVGAQAVEPGMVRQAFIGVSNAQQNAQAEINQARSDRAKILNMAAGPEKKKGPDGSVSGGYEKLLAAIDSYGVLQQPGEGGKPAGEAKLAAARAEIVAQLDLAEGEVARMLSEARSRANEARERAQREYEQFSNYLAAYKKDPKLTAVRLWVRMRDEILSGKQNEIFFVPPNAYEIEVITNRDPQKAIDADRENYRNRTGLNGP